MRSLLRELEGEADLVIVDTAAALAVGDALPLFQTVSGVAMIVRMNRSSRAAVRRLQKVIASAGGTVMGVVATSAGSTTYGYGESYYQTQNGSGTASEPVDASRRSAVRPRRPPKRARHPRRAGRSWSQCSWHPSRARAGASRGARPAGAPAPSWFPPVAPVPSYVPPTAPAPWSVARAAPAPPPATAAPLGDGACRMRLSGR